LAPLLERLKERKVVQWTVAYLAAAWLGLEAFLLVAEQFELPLWVGQGATVVVLFGLLITLIVAWNHGERGRQRVSGSEVVLVGVLLASAGLSVVLLRDRSRDLAAEDTLAAPVAWQRDTPPERSVAVLPCRDLSVEGDREYFASGLAEELTTQLAAIRGVRVAARTSAFSFGDSGADLATIAGALNVRNVLECSVMWEGGRVRISAQLVDAVEGFERWGRSYDRAVESMLAVHGEIAIAVASALEVELQGAERELIGRRGTDSQDAHRAYLRGLNVHWKTPWSVENQLRSLDYANEAIEADSTFASAWALLASTYIGLGNFRVRSPAEVYPKAEEAALRALALDPNLAWAHGTLGWTKLSYSFDWEGAEREFRRAIALGPSESVGYHGLNFALAAQGQFEEAMEAAEEALALDPLALWPRVGLFELRYKMGEFAQMIRDLEVQLGSEPDDPLSLVYLGLAQARTGAVDAAMASASRAEAMAQGDPVITLLVADIYAIAGDTAAARERASRIEAAAASGTGPVLPGHLAMVYATLGDTDRAFEWLSRAVDDFDSIVFSLQYPEFLPVRSDPRFQDLLARVGLPSGAYP
jgi:serine/threonine-protein kinase